MIKVFVALAATVAVSTMAVITPALAQKKDAACVEKCNRASPDSTRPGSSGSRGGGASIRACIADCPAAKSK
jgi:hypothetical protein